MINFIRFPHYKTYARYNWEVKNRLPNGRRPYIKYYLYKPRFCGAYRIINVVNKWAWDEINPFISLC